MFENYQFDGVYIAIQAVLTLYAQGMISDVILKADKLSTELCTVLPKSVYCLEKTEERIDTLLRKMGNCKASEIYWHHDAESTMIYVL